MKKIYFVFAAAALTLAACNGGGTDANKAKEDSIKMADSMKKVNDEAAAKAANDSAAAASKDTTKKVEDKKVEEKKK